ncbi:toll-like receptor 4 [Ruditapes philippinarum]|uniref:toll-like receptor 4 n=1 Tax=Ruditapes philippinarum TaxID=129788 RepID=UPI00295A6CE7|nr:toll-like receptor 4 [Ruditapes philippinarum]
MARLGLILICMFLFEMYHFESSIHKSVCLELQVNKTMKPVFCHGMLKEICEMVRNYSQIERLTATLNDTTLSKDDFNGCESLKELSLSNNNLIHLEKDVLSNMTELTLLDVSHNKLDIYREDTAYELTLPVSLRTLKLNGNIKSNVSVEKLKYPILYQSGGLRSLYIDGLPNKDVNIFKDNVISLEELTMTSKLGNCCIPYIKETTFQSVRANLKLLNISECMIKKFEFGALRGLKKLEVLDLSNNTELGFTALENISFGLQFTNIKVFNYSHVHRPFGKSVTVRKRDLCYLFNTTLDEFAVEGNRIDMFESNSFLLLPSNITTFRIGRNRLSIGLYIIQLGCISSLINLHTGYLDTFGQVKDYTLSPQFLGYISSHEDDCYDNKPSNCPFMADDFLNRTASSRQQLTCTFYNGHNNPVSLPKNIKNIHAPQCGYVSALISIINIVHSRLFRGFFQIERLDLSRNRIYNVTVEFIKARHLKYLDLSENRCEHMDIRTGITVPNLEELQIQNNLLGPSLEDRQFETFPNLKVLNLSDNLIQDLPKNVFMNMTNLKILDLSSNKIQEWTANIDSLKSLIHLNLSHNVLSSLPSSLMNHFDKMGHNFSIDLRNNTLKYSCNNEDFLLWIVKHKKNIVGYETFTFSDTLTFDDVEKQIAKLNRSCNAYTAPIAISSVFITIFFLVVIGRLVYRNRWQIRYFVYMTKRRYFSINILPDEDVDGMYKYGVFISYAEDNNQFISDQLVPNLEQHGLSLCIHQRDFVAGRSIIDNIISAVQSSKITLVILSREFINSKWCMYEFQMARMESIYTRADNNCLLIVMKDNIPIEDMPLEMMNWIRYESYLEYSEDVAGEQLFWERLKETLNIK